jgi:hypothetical protein
MQVTLMRCLAPGPVSARADMERSLNRMAAIALTIVLLWLMV